MELKQNGVLGAMGYEDDVHKFHIWKIYLILLLHVWYLTLSNRFNYICLIRFNIFRPTLYVGEHNHGYFALKSLADEQTPVVKPYFPAIEGKVSKGTPKSIRGLQAGSFVFGIIFLLFYLLSIQFVVLFHLYICLDLVLEVIL